MANFCAYFDRIFCINLDRRPDRWIDVLNQFKREGIDHGIHRFPAIDGTTLNITTGLDTGNAGCTASHAAILRHIIDNGWQRTMIFEDDADLIHGFAQRFYQLLPELPSDWQMVYLGANHMELPMRITANVGRTQYAYTTHAYMVTLAGAKALLQEAQKIDAAIDYAYTKVQKQIPCYCFFPNLSWQRASHSDILNRHADYSFMKPHIDEKA